MKTKTYTDRTIPTESAFGALVTFSLGALIGFVLGQQLSVPMGCQTHPLRAHFLERYIAFDTTTSPERRTMTETLREAAPETPATVPFEPASASSVIAASSSSPGPSAAAYGGEFPAFGQTVFPVGRVPDWGGMRTPAEWNKTYAEMDRTMFVRVPAYDLDVLTTPMKTLLATRDEPKTIAMLTTKLFYSTRFFGTYDIDAGEFTGDHVGIDLKLPEGTPVVSVAGGTVRHVAKDLSGLGLHVIIEHRLDRETFYSVYGHLESVLVQEGQSVDPGTQIATSGNTGRSTAPHLHLQIDRGEPNEAEHAVYWPKKTLTPEEAALRTLHPVSFITTHAQR